MAVRASTKAVEAALATSLTISQSTSKKAALKAPHKLTPKARRRSKLKAVTEKSMPVGTTGLRRYRLYKPPSQSTGAPRPLLVMLHGCLQDAQAIASLSQMNRLAAREGFFVLYPEQDRMSNPQGCWNWFATRTGQAQREAESIIAVIDHVCQSQRVDANQIAVAGFSAGASMAALLGSRQPTRFRAVAMHSGVATGVATSQATALRAMRGRGPVPAALSPADPGKPLAALLVIHGSADPVVAPSNGMNAAMQWAACEGATAIAVRKVQRGNGHAVTITDFKVTGRLVATHRLISGLGHAWSGGAPGLAHSDPKGPNASRMIWSFAKKQFALPQSRAKGQFLQP